MREKDGRCEEEQGEEDTEVGKQTEDQGDSVEEMKARNGDGEVFTATSLPQLSDHFRRYSSIVLTFLISEMLISTYLCGSAHCCDYM